MQSQEILSVAEAKQKLKREVPAPRTSRKTLDNLVFNGPFAKFYEEIFLSGDLPDSDLTSLLTTLGQSTLIWEQIKSRCSKYLEQMRDARTAHNMLLRGRSGSELIYIGTSPQRRWTTDTPSEEQTQVDNLLSKAGFQALRSNSIFATSDYSTTTDYGDSTYIIVPFDSANITWNRYINDYYGNLIMDYNSLYEYLSHKKLIRVPDLGLLLDLMSNTIRKYEKETDITPQLNDKIGKVENLISYLGDSQDEPNQPYPIIKLLKLTINYMQGLIPALAKANPKFNKEFLSIHRQLKNALDQINQTIEKLNQPKTARALAQSMGFVSGDLTSALVSMNEIYVHGQYYAIKHPGRSQLANPGLELMTNGSADDFEINFGVSMLVNWYIQRKIK